MLLRLAVEVPSSVVICVKTRGEFPVVCVKPEVRSSKICSGGLTLWASKRVLSCMPEKALS